METQKQIQNQENYPQKNFIQRNALSLKIILIGILILIMMIPLAMIQNLISERANTASEAALEVQQKWSGAQEISGPVLSIPFYEERETYQYTSQGNEVKINKVLNYLHLLPETLEINGNIETSTLKRGLYEIVVYKTPLVLKGKFILPENLSKEANTEQLLLQNATLNMGISDLRGIGEQIEVNWGDTSYQFNPGLPSDYILNPGVSTPIDINSLKAGETLEFTIHLALRGSASLHFAPMGKTTRVQLTSNCRTPSFTGSFLPENRDISEKGFTSDWKILNLNRSYPQIFKGNTFYDSQTLSTFGVDLLQPVQQYQQSMRSAKYAYLIIILTFVVSFFAEIMQKKNIHPFQYLLIGLALCLFYTLLISFSEHLGFSWAYLISALLTITLLTFYMSGILKIRKTALTIGGLLTLLYVYIFILIQMETYALLTGSIGLFIILAVIMYYSQKINWNEHE